MRPIPRAVLLFLAIAVVAVASGQAPAKDRGLLSVLHAGQAIALKDAGAGYEIQLLVNGPEPLGHKVIEVLGDCVVVEDLAGVSQTRIPIYSIKSIVVTKLGGPR
jgi:hypothetical protein